MEIYNCKVLLGGSRENEVRKLALPAPEVMLLKHIHGDDHVIEVKHIGTSEIDGAQVREILALTYANDQDPRTAPLLREVFGPPTVGLPKVVEGVEHLKKPALIPVEKITRWRETRPEVVPVQVSEPSFAD